MRQAVIWLIIAALITLSGCAVHEPDTNVYSASVPIPESSNAQTIVCGQSGSGKYPLNAYRFGTGENVLLLTFCIHGWEDAFECDGTALFNLGNATIDWLNQNSSLIANGNWSVYVLPCLNPDGLYLGRTTDGCGRCTQTSDDKMPVDMNRCFPYRFSSYDDPRNFNGAQPLSCTEARALADFVPSVMGNGKNISIDVHGWYQQILTTGGKNDLYRILRQAFPENEYTSLEKGYGYFSAWCGYVLGFDACLLELPKIESMEEYENSEITEAFLSALETVLTEMK